MRDIAQLQGYRATNIVAITEVLLIFSANTSNMNKPEDLTSSFRLTLTYHGFVSLLATLKRLKSEKC